ncbi:hypothetical protein [Methylobacterium nigriterrae]|uniref:hypothetical protein n=1 Tax=Methylobacterium nigriterrae TaxID=3127512 RepID=UPI00301387CE
MRRTLHALNLALLLGAAGLAPAFAQESKGAAAPASPGADRTAKDALGTSDEITGSAKPTADQQAGSRTVPGSGIKADPGARTPQDPPPQGR